MLMSTFLVYTTQRDRFHLVADVADSFAHNLARNGVHIVRAQTEAVTSVYGTVFVKETTPVGPVRNIDKPGVLESVYELFFAQSRE
jgi:hypothetical protein